MCIFVHVSNQANSKFLPFILLLSVQLKTELQSTSMVTYLELHGRVLFILWCGVALVVEVVWGGGVNDSRFRGRLMETLTVYVDQEG